ncbi:alpha/beta hydrolase [Mycobacterium sp. MYCO198283]|uniref:alpha/beta hydrolase n=1 Tax=Mycobacterium sp. MYCO198283 TaxID=2883505 RepID=UPI001E555A1D|nr:alpha/beta hydrolase [Mycobacterium sp. MYCO198283]MCG5432154.1 alpha/beta hydrolase [Mycobacterium sp. MYCO198283]
MASAVSRRALLIGVAGTLVAAQPAPPVKNTDSPVEPNKERMTMTKEVTFDRDGMVLAGTLFTPTDFDESAKYRALIVQGSLTSVKEQMPYTYAARFAEQGFVALAFDYSHYGKSEGQPRQLESPPEKLADLQAAVTYLQGLPFVQAVGMVGICTSGGNAAYLAAQDSRVQAVATVAGMFPGPDLAEQLNGGPEGLQKRRDEGAAALREFQDNGIQRTIPCYSETDPTALNYRDTPGAYDYYLNPERGGVPEWTNEFAVASFGPWFDFDPVSQAGRITTPTMVVHSDGCAFPDRAKAFYAALQGPKELVWADGTHFDYYDSPAQINNAVANVTRFLKKHMN